MKNDSVELMFSSLLFQKPQHFKGLLIKSPCFCFHRVTKIHLKINENHHFSFAIVLWIQMITRMFFLFFLRQAYAFRIEKVLTYKKQRKWCWKLPQRIKFIKITKYNRAERFC